MIADIVRLRGRMVFPINTDIAFPRTTAQENKSDQALIEKSLYFDWICLPNKELLRKKPTIDRSKGVQNDFHFCLIISLRVFHVESVKKTGVSAAQKRQTDGRRATLQK